MQEDVSGCTHARGGRRGPAARAGHTPHGRGPCACIARLAAATLLTARPPCRAPPSAQGPAPARTPPRARPRPSRLTWRMQLGPAGPPSGLRRPWVAASWLRLTKWMRRRRKQMHPTSASPLHHSARQVTAAADSHPAGAGCKDTPQGCMEAPCGPPPLARAARHPQSLPGRCCACCPLPAAGARAQAKPRHAPGHMRAGPHARRWCGRRQLCGGRHVR